MLSVKLDVDASKAIEKLERLNFLLDEMIHKLNVLNQDTQNDDIVALRELGNVKSVSDFVSFAPR